MRENIITRHDELYRAGLDIASVTNKAKEVQNYSEALLRGFIQIKNSKFFINVDLFDMLRKGI